MQWKSYICFLIKKHNIIKMTRTNKIIKIYTPIKPNQTKQKYMNTVIRAINKINCPDLSNRPSCGISSG